GVRSRVPILRIARATILRLSAWGRKGISVRSLGSGLSESPRVMKRRSMKLWTYQPEGFQIDAPGARIDPTQGHYWKTMPNYKPALTKLYDVLGIENYQALWCYTDSGVPWRESHPRVKWELDVPDSRIPALINEEFWGGIVHGGDWSIEDQAIIKERPIKPEP